MIQCFLTAGIIKCYFKYVYHSVQLSFVAPHSVDSVCLRFCSDAILGAAYYDLLAMDKTLVMIFADTESSDRELKKVSKW